MTIYGVENLLLLCFQPVDFFVQVFLVRIRGQIFQVAHFDPSHNLYLCPQNMIIAGGEAEHVGAITCSILTDAFHYAIGHLDCHFLPPAAVTTHHVNSVVLMGSGNNLEEIFLVESWVAEALLSAWQKHLAPSQRFTWITNFRQNEVASRNAAITAFIIIQVL